MNIHDMQFLAGVRSDIGRWNDLYDGQDARVTFLLNDLYDSIGKFMADAETEGKE